MPEVPDNVMKMDHLERVQWQADKLLSEEFEANSQDEAISSTEIYDAADDAWGAADVAKNTFRAYLSKLAKDPDSRITCQGRRQGYYLTGDAIESVQDDEEGEEEGRSRDYNQKEKYLYRVIKQWLLEKDYRAKDISSQRKMGKLGNPDLAGIEVAEKIDGGLYVSLVTVEAKFSQDNWRVDFFEAVAQRRFANRTYFAFGVVDEVMQKIPDDMRYYSELYGVGVLSIGLSKDLYKKIEDGELEEELDIEETEIREWFNAPYHDVRVEYKNRFIREALGIGNKEGLWTWGS